MLEALKSLWKFVDYNRYFCAAVVVSALVALYGWGCESTTSSLTADGAVNRTQLNAEIERFNAEQVAQAELFKTETAKSVATFNAQQDARVAAFNTALGAKADAMGISAEAAHSDLDRQDEIRAAIVNVGTQLVSPALGPYAGGVAALVAAALGGDNIRKRAVIKKLKEG